MSSSQWPYFWPLSALSLERERVKCCFDELRSGCAPMKRKATESMSARGKVIENRWTNDTSSLRKKSIIISIFLKFHLSFLS